MTTTQSDLIPLSEVLAQGATMYWLDRVHAKVVTDWADRPAVTASAATAALRAAKEAERANDERHRLYREYLVQHDRDRQAAGDAAVAKARPAFLRRQQEEALGSGTIFDGGTITQAGQLADPRTISSLSQVRREALEAFDRKHPPKTVEDFG